MNARSSRIVILSLILISFLIGAYYYPMMPERIASHWGINGQVDGYTSKFWGLFLLPIILTVMFILFEVIPKIDPLKENIKEFVKYYYSFMVIISAFLFYLYILTIFWNTGTTFNMIRFLVPAFAALFYYCGILVGKAKRNWFIGIKTPWTISNDTVWEKTHKIGEKLFKAVALISLLGVIFDSYAFALLIIPVILVSLYLCVYSYVEYQRELKKS